jgi:Bacterial toxin 44
VAQAKKGFFLTVKDGLEDTWDAAAKGWREANEQKFAADMRKAEVDRQIVQGVISGARRTGQTVVNGVKGSRAGKVASALFADTPSTKPPPTDPVDKAEVRRRMAEMEANTGQMIQAAAASENPEALAGVWPAAAGEWIGNVRSGGAHDDKSGGNHERMGNFSYGATAATLGLSKEIALRGAGAYQRWSNLGKAVGGRKLTPSVGLLNAPYGDDPRDQPAISEGYDYAVEVRRQQQRDRQLQMQRLQRQPQRGGR